ncbi:hypothetical protein HPB49_004489 [Dermacentor silvarum]|uniref:Uncharacterized protein n=1 Tax=Dermacentor silvarum TaxID=543639 RepID=A0ACB8DUA1_DERSI|nr:hypothetical protein HPB49_004489 [Dermacentor silvarum]
MGSRSKKQVMNRYNRSLHPGLRRGRWTAQEDVMLLIAVASMLPGRTGGQCRYRYKDNFEQQIVSGPYTPDEDYSLLELVQKHGVGHWSKSAGRCFQIPSHQNPLSRDIPPKSATPGSADEGMVYLLGCPSSTSDRMACATPAPL